MESQLNAESIDYSIWANLYSSVLYNLGFYKNALNFVTKAINNFQTIYSEDTLNQYLLNLQLNQLSIKSYLSTNFNETRKEFLKFIALASSLKDKRLLVKANYEYASFLISAGQRRASLPYSKIAYNIQKELTPFDYNIYAITSQTLMSSNDSNPNNFLTRKREERFNKSVLLKNIENEDYYSAAFIYLNSSVSQLNQGNNSEALHSINKALDLLQQHGYDDKLLALSYLKKWGIEEAIGRNITSKYYLNKAKDIMVGMYGTGSYELSKFYQGLIYDLITAKNYLEAKKYVNINNQIISGLTQGNANIFTLNTAFLNVCASVNDNFTDTLIQYTNFRKICESVLGHESEILFEMNLFLKSNNLSKVYKFYENK